MTTDQAQIAAIAGNLLRMLDLQRSSTRGVISHAFSGPSQEPVRLSLIKELEAGESLAKETRTLLAALTGAHVFPSVNQGE